MGKKTFLAFFLSLLVIVVYNYFFAQKYPPPTQPGFSEKKADLGPSPIVSLAPRAEKDVLITSAPSKGEDVVVETDLVKIVITSSGARIKSYELKKYAEEKIDPKGVQRQLAEIERTLLQSAADKREFLQHERKKLAVLLQKLEHNSMQAELVSLAATCAADFSPSIILPGLEEASFAVNTQIYESSAKFLSLHQTRPTGKLEFIYADAQGRRLKKVYTFSNSSYSIGLRLEFTNWDERLLPAGYFLLAYGPDVGLPQVQRGRRSFAYSGPLVYSQSGKQGWVKKENFGRAESNRLVKRELSGQIIWAGLVNKYFLAALIPSQPVEKAEVTRNKFGEHKVALKVPWTGRGVYNFRLYQGPKKEEQLKSVDVTLGKTIDYGFFSPIARLIFKLLIFFSRWTNNFGWAIVLLCLMIKVVFYPLTHHSFESMQKMQQQMKALQPEMTALREKFKDNPQKINKETMELYRRKGINPLASCQSGCLPLLLQMPVFFALYAVLYNSIELRGTPFFGWITDLSAKDPYYVLPVLMGVSMFLQQKLTGMGTTGGAQQEQAKMMAMLMPVFLTWIFASLPSGVVLYWLTFNIFTALQQLIIRKKQVTVVA